MISFWDFLDQGNLPAFSSQFSTPRTTGTFDRRGDEISLDEVERIVI
jgi:hypothetical protein